MKYRTIVADPPWEYPEGFALGPGHGLGYLGERGPRARRGCDVTFLPCPGGCGRKVPVHDKWQTSNEAGGPLHCSSCIALVKAQVERHAALWAPILCASLAMTGRWPEIDPSLLRSET